MICNQSLFAGKTRTSGLSLNLFTNDELDDIHLATLEVLQKTGIFVENAEALDIFENHGAKVNRQSKMVQIPSHLVDESIRSAPSRVTLYGRNPKHDLVLDTTRIHFTNFSEGVLVVDPFTGELREPVKKDLENTARVIDYLDDVDFCEKALGAHDVDQTCVPLHNAEAILPNTSKHCAFGPGNGKLLHKIIDMGIAIAGSEEKFYERPMISFTTCPVSPLKLIDDVCQIIMETARTGTVCNILSMAMAGATAPVTLAGALVTHNAEILGGITLSQLTRKGAPVIYGSSTTAMDLRMGTASVGTPEAGLVSGAVACLARYYKIPSYVGGT
jgi:trimethylamine--corrinoid protein Co-methyltransferase